MVTQLNWCESALFMTAMARDNLAGHMGDLRAQIADLRLRKAEDALRGIVDLERYEKKMLGR